MRGEIAWGQAPGRAGGDAVAAYVLRCSLRTCLYSAVLCTYLHHMYTIALFRFGVFPLWFRSAGLVTRLV